MREEDSVALEQCTRQLVLTVAKNAKSHSDPQRGDRSIVENVIQNTEDSE